MSWSEAIKVNPEAGRVRRECVERSLMTFCRSLQRSYAMGDNELSEVLLSLSEWFAPSPEAVRYEQVGLHDVTHPDSEED